MQLLTRFYIKLIFATLTMLISNVAYPQSDFVWRKLMATEKLPTDEIRCSHQDKMGFVWFGTNNGLLRYDGFHVKAYRNTEQNPFLLSSKTVTCLADDGNTTLWIGTKKGLNRMDMRTGYTRAYHFDDFDNSDAVNKLLFTNGTLWVGTEGGLYRYDSKDDSFELLCDQRGNSKVPHASVTSIYQKRPGFLWVGTWDRGLYRYDINKNKWYELPPFNPRHSAQAIYEDEKGILWVGTWDSGLYKIMNPYATNVPLKFVNFNISNTQGGLNSNIVWNIAYDSQTNKLWLGTPKGLSMLDTYNGKDIVSLLPSDKEPEQDFFGLGASSFFYSNNGRLWISGTHRGLASVYKTSNSFVNWTLPSGILYKDYISSLYYSSPSSIFVALRNNGFLTFNPTNTLDSKYYPISTSVNGFASIGNGEVAVCTEREGLMIYKDGEIIGAINTTNAPWLTDNCVYTMVVDDDNNWLVGSYKGLSIRYVNGKGVHLDGEKFGVLPTSQIYTIVKSGNSVWLGTRNNGILHLQGDIHNLKSLKVKQYDVLHDTKLKINTVKKIITDLNGTVWACSSEAGLLMYDKKIDGFVNANKMFGLPDDEICSVELSKKGEILVSMRNNIAIITIDAQSKLKHMRFLTRYDMLGENSFAEALSSVSSDGKVCFGGYDGVLVMKEPQQIAASTKVKPYVTDIKIFGRSMDISDFTDSVSVILPPYSKELTLNHDQRDITIEFSTLDFDNTSSVRFMYKLDGYDSEWRYCGVDAHEVSYNNLSSGKYVFHLRATDNNGQWGPETTMIIKVQYPWFLRWYSWIVYALLAAFMLYIVFRYFKNKELTRREVQLAHLEKQNIEELNHKKLQFFTNITHDLMTPLTVISATVNTLSSDDPKNEASYKVIDGNVNRLMRLLQQILEFRKSETGNQHLRVSKASLSDFVSKEIESLRPLANKKQLHFSFICNPKEIIGYFDSDKLDKIIYNLVSNAIKYNSPMGYVQVSLESIDGKTLVLTVKDNGVGISEEKLPKLFTRFYEGEHRKFKTFGTGIGLSLTRDLVELHHGSITVESVLNEGSTFTVTLPISEESFEPEEIDNFSNTDEIDDFGDNTEKEEVDNSANKSCSTILVVEDNEELLTMLVKLLSSKYKVLKAYNGKEALDVLDSDNVDLVLTDVMMPVMDGIELTRQIHIRSEKKMIPVIMLTAKRDDEDRAEAYRAGADAYITKPFNTSVLMARIDNLLSNRQNVAKELNSKFFANLKDINLSSDDEHFVSSCIECVQQHIGNSDFDLDAFAAAMNISKSSLYKKLNSATSLSPSAFVRNIRMKYASELLSANPKARIADIAYSVGYNDPKYFSNCFKKEFGVLPKEWGK